MVIRALAALLLLLSACGGAAPAASSSSPTPAASDDAPSIVGEWVGFHKCERIVTMLTEAGLDEFILEQVVELVPGATTPEDIDPTDPCRGAVRREHSHFFTADGLFGSRDFNGQQVDEGTYTLEGDDVVAINGETFHYRIDGDSISFQPDPVDISECTDRMCRFLPTWVLTVAMPGTTWTRGTISGQSDALVGSWTTGSVSFDQIRGAMLDAGLAESDFTAWAEEQDLAPWPDDPQAPNELAMELRFLADDRWEIGVDSGGESLGIVDEGTCRLRDGELDLTSAADGDVGSFAAALGDDRLTLTLLDTQEVGTTEAAYIHRLFAVALFASAPFVRTSP